MLLVWYVDFFLFGECLERQHELPNSQSDPRMIKEIVDAVTIPVMAKVRIGHFVEAQVSCGRTSAFFAIFAIARLNTE